LVAAPLPLLTLQLNLSSSSFAGFTKKKTTCFSGGGGGGGGGIMAKHKLNWQIQALVAIITLVIIYPSWIPVCNATADDEGKLTQICQTIAIFTNPYFWPFSSAQLSSAAVQCV
jgi:hypothetical protein